MSNTASALIKVAKGEVGYLEKKSNSSLDSKTANAGSANYTKYNKLPGFTNPAYWCAAFTSWCFYTAFGASEGKQVGFIYSQSCETIRSKFKAMNSYYGTPKAGDLVFFSGTRHSGANHIGIVTKVEGGKVCTVEGNTSGGSSVVDNGGGVATKSYALTNTRILGYGRPNYDAETSKEFDMASLPSIKYGSTGAHVKTLQAILKAKYGKPLSVDGDFGNNTTKKLKEVQKTLGLSQDGVCGVKTWGKVL